HGLAPYPHAGSGRSLLRSHHIPDVDASVPPGAGEVLAVRAEGHLVHRVGLGFQGQHHVALLGVVDHQLFLPGETGDALGVRAPGDGVGGGILPVLLDADDVLARVRLPDLDAIVVAAAGEPLAVGAPGHAPQRSRLALVGQGNLAAVGLPDRHRVVEGAAGHARAVRAVAHVIDAALGSRERLHVLAAFDVPELDLTGRRGPAH